MSTPINGSPHDPHDGRAAGSGSGAGSQHSAPDFGGWQQDQNGGTGSSAAPSYGAPSFGGSPSGASGQQAQSSGAPQYRPAGGGTPQYTPAGGQYGTQYGGHQQGGTGRKGRGRPPLWVGLTSLLLGLTLGLIAIIVFFASVVGSVGSIANAPSGTQQVLDDGTRYYVYSTGTDPVDRCTVYTPGYDSMELELSDDSGQTMTDDDQTFRMLGSFTTEEEGQYRVSCMPYVADDEMRISDAGVGGMVGGTLASIGLGTLGGLLFLLGLILIIVNRVTASKSRG